MYKYLCTLLTIVSSAQEAEDADFLVRVLERDEVEVAEAAGQGKTLVIVESATKAKKIQPYLGDKYIVEASVGHIRDLPRGAADVPAKYKKEPWARLGVNPEDNFTPLYVISQDKKKKVADLKAKLKQCDQLYLATDPDREG